MKYLLACLLLLIFIGCKKDPHHPDPAKGFLQRTEYGQCFPDTGHGTWYNGYPAATDSNYVDVNIRVTSPGSYNITTDKMNGVMFAASGNFTDTGLNTVRLKAKGSFINPVETIFPITFDSSSCSIYVLVQDSAGLSLADNTWQFTAGGRTYRGNCTGYFYPLPQDLGYSFEFKGSSLSGSPDTVLEMGFVTNAPDTGSYPTSDKSYFGFYASGNAGRTNYGASANTIPAVIDIHFTSFTTVFSPQYRMTWLATFNGTARDTANNIVPITNARFKLVNQ